MDLINFLIDFSTLAGAAYLGAMFIAGPGRWRLSAVVNVPPVDAPAVESPRLVKDSVVPFRRRVRPAVAMPTDRELIELAKSTDYPGAKKWSYSRPLTQKTRAALLKVWGTLAA